MGSEYSFYKIPDELLKGCERLNEIYKNGSEDDLKMVLNSVYGTRLASFEKPIYISSADSFAMKNLLTLKHRRSIPEINRVIFNRPATIVFWKDGTKTVVKAQGEPFDEEKGLTMAICKKLYGNTGAYFNEIRKWLPEIVKSKVDNSIDLEAKKSVESRDRNEIKTRAYNLDGAKKSKITLDSVETMLESFTADEINSALKRTLDRFYRQTTPPSETLYMMIVIAALNYLAKAKEMDGDE